MSRHLWRVLSLTVAAALVFGSALPVTAATPRPQDGSPWPQFQRDAARTGRTTINGPLAPEQKWLYDTGEVLTSGLAVAADGTIYATSRDWVFAITSDGKQRWRYEVQGGDNTAPAIDRVGDVIVGTEDGRVLGIKPDGTLDWTFNVATAQYAAGASAVRGPLLLANGYCCMLVGAEDGNVYKLEEGGGQIGVRRANGKVTAAPALAPDSSEYWASQAKELYSGIIGGGNRWRIVLDGAIYAGPVLGPGSIAYVGTGNGTLFAIRPDGTEKWRQELSAGSALRAAPSLGTDGTIYIGSDNGKVYAVASDTGTVKWEYATNGPIHAPALIDGRGNIYVASRDKKVYILSPTGALQASFETGGAIEAAMAIGADGTLYVASEDRKLYALKEGGAAQAIAAAAAAGTATLGPTVTIQRDRLRGHVYLVGGGVRRWVPDPATAALLRIGPTSWENVSPDQLATIPEAAAVPSLGEGSLIRVPSGAIYVIRNQTREWIPSLAAFVAAGYRWESVIAVDAAVAQRIPLKLPDGMLVKGSGPKVYVIENGSRRWISSLEMFQARGYRWDQVVPAGDDVLLSIPEISPLGIDEGAIIKGSGPKVYVIENGLRRWIPTLEAFFARGYRWDRLMVVSDEALSTVREGAPLPP